MAYPTVGILHDIDKCVRCRGCVVACKRRSNMTPTTTAEFASYGDSDSWGNNVSAQELMVVKSQKSFDMRPFVRYSCWHCVAPSCVKACPLKAISRLGSTHRANGAVVVDYTKCNPNVCGTPCVNACRFGGYTKIQETTGTGFTRFYTGARKMNKCDMCYDRLDAGKVPLCVITCPADALKFDTMGNLVTYLQSRVPIGSVAPAGSPRFKSHSLGQGGQVIWASNMYFQFPKADPYVEDHMSQAVDKLLRGPFARLAMVPAGLALGLLALQKRKDAVKEEACVG